MNLLATMAALAKAYAEDTEKPVWVQEFGASTSWMPETEVPAYLERSVQSGIEGGVSWFTWWCSHDIDRRFRFDELEYSLGLLDVNNHPKPQAHVFRDLARSFGGKQVASPSTLPPPPAHDTHSTWAWMQSLAQ